MAQVWLFDQFDNLLNTTGHISSFYETSNVDNVMHGVPVTKENGVLLLNVLPGNANLPEDRRLQLHVVCNGTDTEYVEEKSVVVVDMEVKCGWVWDVSRRRVIASVASSEEVSNYRKIRYTVTLRNSEGGVVAPTQYRLVVAHQTPDNGTTFAVVSPQDMIFTHSVTLQRRGVHHVTMYVVDSTDVAARAFDADYDCDGGVPTSFFVYGNGTAFPQCNGNVCAGKLFIGGKVSAAAATDD